MNSSINKHAVVVGIFTLLGILILIIAIFTLSSQKNIFVKSTIVKAVFNDVGGLKVGDNVWLSGVKVGVVKTIGFNDSAGVIIEMKVEKIAQQLLHTDSKAKVGSDGLMGNRIIIIYGGTKTSPKISENGYLLVERSQTTKDMLATLDTSNKNLLAITDNLKRISNKILNGQGSLSTLLNDSALPENLKHTILELKTTVANFKTTSAQSKEMMENLVGFSAQLHKKGTFINDVVTDTVLFNHLLSTASRLKETVDTLSGFTDNLKKAGSRLNQTDNTMGLLLNDEATAARLSAMISNLDSASHKLNEDLEAVKHNFLFRRYFKNK